MKTPNNTSEAIERLAREAELRRILEMVEKAKSQEEAAERIRELIQNSK